jgi:hypothetical protein
VDRFLPPYQASFQLDPINPCAFNQLAPPNVYMEMRYNIQTAMEAALPRFGQVEEEFAEIFGRRYGAVEAIECDDAEIVLVTSGTVTGTSRQVVQAPRARGEKVGLLKVKLFRPCGRSAPGAREGAKGGRDRPQLFLWRHRHFRSGDPRGSLQHCGPSPGAGLYGRTRRP